MTLGCVRPRMSRAFIALAGVATLVACASSPPEPMAPITPARALGLAFAPGPCIEGKNVVPASAFARAPNARAAYLQPTDGTLRFELFPGAAATPVSVRWRDVAGAPEGVLPAGPPWNLELSFVSPAAGECPIQVDFEPSAEGVAKGLGRATTTIVLKQAPPPPRLQAP